MISAGGFLGKVAEYLVGELSKRKFAKDTDKKGHACEAFTRLYFLLTELQAITSYVQDGAKAALEQKDATVLASFVWTVQRRLKVTSNDYLETVTMLYEPLEIFAPDVGRALGVITNWKFNILWEVSDSFVLDGQPGGQAIVRMRYLKPDDRLLEIDLAAYARRVVSGEASIRANQFEWPETFLTRGDKTSAFTEVEFNFATLEDVRQLDQLLEKHAAALDAGKNALREFIKVNFTIAEVLYEKKHIEPAWFH